MTTNNIDNSIKISNNSDLINNDNEIFEIIDILGSGTYGTVYKANLLVENNVKVAVKKIKIEMENEGVPSTALREISILRDLKHPNIVELKNVLCKDQKLFLIFELLQTDLKKFIESYYIKEKSNNKMYKNINNNVNFNTFDIQESLIKKYMHQLLSGIAYCHSKKVIHRDLKPANLLLDSEGILKIADFGLARVFSVPIRPYTKEVLTLWYRAPEILLGSIEYNTSVDIWSVGCIFAEMYLKKPLFFGEYDIDQIFKIFNILGTPNMATWPDVYNLQYFKKTFPKWDAKSLNQVIPKMSVLGLDLLSKLLVYDPNQRITAKQALSHVILITI